MLKSRYFVRMCISPKSYRHVITNVISFTISTYRGEKQGDSHGHELFFSLHFDRGGIAAVVAGKAGE